MARRPDPPPLETNDVRTIAVGTAGWVIALVVLLLVDLPERDRWWLWVCATGIGGGLFGMFYIPRLHRQRAAAEAARLAAESGTGDADGAEKEKDEKERSA